MLTKNDLTEKHIERIRRELNREPEVYRAGNRIRVEDVDYEQPTGTYWSGAVEAYTIRDGRGGWYWRVDHLWRDEILLAEGTARTKQDAVDKMVDALIEHARDGASRRDLFRAWMRGTVQIVA